MIAICMIHESLNKLDLGLELLDRRKDEDAWPTG